MESDQSKILNEEENKVEEQVETGEKSIIEEIKCSNDVDMPEVTEVNETESIQLPEEPIISEETKKDELNIEEVEMTDTENIKSDETKKNEEVESQPIVDIPKDEKSTESEKSVQNRLTEVVTASEVEIDQNNDFNFNQPLEESNEIKNEPTNENESTKNEEEKAIKPSSENPQVISSQSSKKPKIDLTLMQTRQYLDHTIVPILFGGLSSLAKARPENPIEYLANYLLENKSKYDNNQENSSLNGNQ